MQVLKNRLVLVVIAVGVGALGASCLTPAGSANQDRTYFACAAPGGVIDPASLRIDNQPVCASGKTLQQWTQHGDTSDIVSLTADVPEFPASTITAPNGAVIDNVRSGWVDVIGAETTMKCGYVYASPPPDDCSALVVRGTTVTFKAHTEWFGTQYGLPAASRFVGWSGVCEGQDIEITPDCTVTANTATHVTALFAPAT